MKKVLASRKIQISFIILLVASTIFITTKKPQITNFSENNSNVLIGGKTDQEWKETLTPLQYSVLRQKGTEIPFTGELLEEKRKGTYVTADCREPVFRSEQKYDSGTGWPSFWAPIEGAIEEVIDEEYGMVRTEVLSKKCKSHLGHVFTDGPEPTGLRYCINSAALIFIPDKKS